MQAMTSLSHGLLCFPPLFTERSQKSQSISARPAKKLCVFRAKMSALTSAATPTSFGFVNLMETFTVDVQRAENRPLNVPLIAPFTIASSRLDKVENVAIRVELRNGSVGWGEAPMLPFVTSEDQPTAMAKAAEACEFLRHAPALTLGSLLKEIEAILPGHEFASVRAGVEMALIDAVANNIRVPLWRLFGGASNTITTDITIPIVGPTEAAKLASKYQKEGFKTLKLKVGKNLKSDIEVLQAIRVAHSECQFILDANEGYNHNEAVEVLEKLHEMGVTPILFEQPVHRDDWEGLGYVSFIARDKYGVSVAADESCRTLDDVSRIAEGNLVDVINIKLAKVGVVGALNIIDLARAAGLNLMIGGMVETRLAMGFAGHLAAGLGCFKFIDLDTPLLLSEDPVLEGYEVSGATYKFTNVRGHGGFLHWDNIAWICRMCLSQVERIITLSVAQRISQLLYVGGDLFLIARNRRSVPQRPSQILSADGGLFPITRSRRLRSASSTGIHTNSVPTTNDVLASPVPPRLSQVSVSISAVSCLQTFCRFRSAFCVLCYFQT